MFDREAYLLEKIKSSEKKLLLKVDVAIFSPNIYLNETHVELTDDKFLYGTVD